MENDQVKTAMLNEPGGKLVVELVTRCAIRFPKVRAWASLRGLMSMEGIQFVDIKKQVHCSENETLWHQGNI